MTTDLIPELLNQAERLLHSDNLGYVLAGVVIAIWWAASSVVGALRRGRVNAEPRPRRRLPLQ